MPRDRRGGPKHIQTKMPEGKYRELKVLLAQYDLPMGPFVLDAVLEKMQHMMEAKATDQSESRVSDIL